MSDIEHHPGPCFIWLAQAGIAVAEAAIADHQDDLFSDERDAIASALPKRRREFATGRRLARLAMAQLGVEPRSLPVGPHREPLWPAALCGSITHTEGWCAAAVAQKGAGIAAIGFDLERDGPLAQDLIDAVCTEAERDHLAQQTHARRSHQAHRIFSAKESFYKAQFAITGRYLDMHDVTVTLGLTDGRFVVEMNVDAAPFHRGRQFEGRLQSINGHIATAVVMSASSVNC